MIEREQGGRRLKTLRLKHRYKSATDDILEGFFIPALAASRYYYRVAGFFSSNVLSAVAKGLAAFVRSGEKMRLVVGAILREEDVEAINQGHRTAREVLEANLGPALADLEDALETRRLEVLAWLVSAGKLDIRVAIPLDDAGRALPSKAAYWHEKFAIFEDDDGDQIQIEGSINETRAGWTAHSESFSVHRNWVKGQRDFVDDAYREFCALWRGEISRALVLDLPSAARRALLEYRPSEAPTVEDLRNTMLGVSASQVLGQLWPHQEEAVESWLNNGQRGVLAMATGSGKTRAALACVSHVLGKDPTVLILVPGLPLLDQWKEKIERLFPRKPIEVCSGETNWRQALPVKLLSSQEPVFILSTVRTAYRGELPAIITKLVAVKRLMLVVDEVHHIGAPDYSRVLGWCKPELGRLGLSATPERHWDPTGTEAILEYFAGVCYRYCLREAIEDGYLCKYRYHPRFVALDSDEMTEYSELSRKIAKRMAIARENGVSEIKDVRDERLRNLLIRRARILKTARRKIPKAAEIIEEEELSRCLVYCDSEEQIDQLAGILERKGIAFATYTSNVVGRELALNRFERGHVDLLLAIRCLDEGVDIPWCEGALILASSTSSAEFIQRRGRILRQHPSKKYARVFDISVLPFDPDLGPAPMQAVTEAEKSILRKEMARIRLFLQDADNFAVEHARLLTVLEMCKRMNVIGKAKTNDG